MSVPPSIKHLTKYGALNWIKAVISTRLSWNKHTSKSSGFALLVDRADGRITPRATKRRSRTICGGPPLTSKAHRLTLLEWPEGGLAKTKNHRRLGRRSVKTLFFLYFALGLQPK